MRILLVEDDPMLGDGIADGLRQHGFTVDWLTCGLPVAATLAAESFAAVILDLTLPDIDGLQVLRRLRRDGSTVPVLILTARDALDDRVTGLDAGADDYLPKPFAMKELISRLRALVRRSKGVIQPELRHGAICLFSEAQQATFNDQPVTLTRQEFRLLEELLLHCGRVMTKELLEQSLYGWNDGVESNAIEVHIHHLRKKFYPELIRNIRGVGYIVEALPSRPATSTVSPS